MKLKKIIGLLFFVLCVFPIFAQKSFDTATEIAYMQLIIEQENPELIEGNLANAERFANMLLLGDAQTDSLASLFFIGLANQYAFIGNNRFAVYSLFRQRCLFGNSKTDAYTELKIKRLQLNSGFSEKEISMWLRETSAGKIVYKYRERIKLLLKLSFWMGDDFYPQAVYLSDFYAQSFQTAKPFWFRQVLFYEQIGLKKERYFSDIQFDKWENSSSNFLEAISDVEYKKEASFKALKFFYRKKAYNSANDVLQGLKNQALTKKEQEKLNGFEQKINKNLRGV